MLVQGKINDVDVDVEIPIEDVESTAVLNFPPTTGVSSDQDVTALKNALSALQNDINNLKAGQGIDVVASGGQAYDFAIFGLSLGAAGVILAIIAMIKRK